MTDTPNEEIYIGKPIEDLYICDCPKCKLGMHFDAERVRQYRERGQKIAKLEAEVARLRANLRRAVEIAEEIEDNRHSAWTIYMDEIFQELQTIKATSSK